MDRGLLKAKESKDIKLVILTSYRPDSYEDIGSGKEMKIQNFKSKEC
ncbi:hypothetical protein ABEY69_03385 [Priestia filamentosa]